MLFIANGTLYPMAEGMPEKIENGSIAVQDGKILKIGNGFTYEDICRDDGRTEQEKKAET